MCCTSSMTVLLKQILILISLRTSSSHINEKDPKSLNVCNVLGGLEITRLVSSTTRNFFQGSIEDVELIREYVTESLTNGGISGGMHNLNNMALTLDHQARNLPQNMTTVEAGLGYVDDRIDRRMERFVGLANEPYVGDKSSDMSIIDTVSNIFPWIVDRKSIESLWWLDHQNGRSEGALKPRFRFDKLYVAAWMGTYGEAWVYYPPLRVYGHPFVFSEVLGERYDSHEEEFVFPNLPSQNLDRRAFFTAPYPDTAVPGLSLITAMAPIYFTGQWNDNTYDDTYLASTGVDIAVSAVSTLLEELEGTLTPSSFAFLVDIDFNMVVISQNTVEKIYPERTGMEDSRVTYDLTSGEIITDRRNQSYLVSDTILQNVTSLTNANWTSLHQSTQDLLPGQRGYTTLDVILTGNTKPASFYVMYERWPNVADWILVSFAPVEEVDNAMSTRFSQNNVSLQALKGTELKAEIVLINDGRFDVYIMVKKIPEWVQSKDTIVGRQLVKAGTNFTLELIIPTASVKTGTQSSLVAINVQDADYPDCYYDRDMIYPISLNVVEEENLNQLGAVRYYGFFLAVLIIITSLGFALWVHVNKRKRIIRASQPLFLLMLCCGTVFMGASIIPLAIDDSIASTSGCSIACLAFPWLFAIGFSMAFSALFSKIWRINRIFKAAHLFKRVKLKTRDVMIPFAVTMSLNVILLLLWTFISPPQWTRVSTSDSSSYGTCWKYWTPASKTFVALISLLNIFALILANVQAYQGRTIADEFSESKYIGLAMMSILQIFVVGVPLMFLVNNNPAALFFLLSSFVLVIAMSLLILIFVPKLWYVRTKREESNQSTQKIPSSFMKSFQAKWNVKAPKAPTTAPKKKPQDEKKDKSDDIGLRITTVVMNQDDVSNDNEIMQYKTKINKLTALLREHDIDLEKFTNGDQEDQFHANEI